MNKQNFYIDLHVLQTVPPSCTNRDDTEVQRQPYTAGYQSQSFQSIMKHAMRAMFSDIFEKEDVEHVQNVV